MGNGFINYNIQCSVIFNTKDDDSGCSDNVTNIFSSKAYLYMIMCDPFFCLYIAVYQLFTSSLSYFCSEANL